MTQMPLSGAHSVPVSTYDDSDTTDASYNDSAASYYEGSTDNSQTASANSFGSLGFASTASVVKNSGPTETLYVTEAGEARSISPLDINQGGIGDCYFLSSLGEIAMVDPTAIQNMITANSNGTYTVTLYEYSNGTAIEPGIYTGDTSFKKVTETVNPATLNFAAFDTAQPSVSGSVEEIWAPVVEAAYAMLDGGYGVIGAGGWPFLAMEALTGQAASWDTNIASVTATLLLNWSKAGDLLTFDTPGSNSQYDLVGPHAYMFEGLTTINGQTYVQLLNPWGLNYASYEPPPIAISQLSSLFDMIDIGTAPAGTAETIAPMVNAISMSSTAGTDVATGKVVVITLTLSAATYVVPGTVALTLNDGGVATYVSGSGTNALSFSYTVATGQSTTALAVTGITESGGVGLSMYDLTGAAGQQASTYLGAATQNSLQINAGPTVSSIKVASASGADINAGKVVTITLGMSAPVVVKAGTVSLALNDGGVATYVSGSGTSTLTFSYTVAAGQNTSSLAVTAINESGTNAAGDLTNASGQDASLSLSGVTQTGAIKVDTVAPTAPTLVHNYAATYDMAELIGTAEANSTVTFYDNGRSIGSVAASSTGAYTYTTGALSGTNLFTETATDGAGNVSAASSVNAGVTVATANQTIALSNTPGQYFVSLFNTANDVLQFSHTLFATYAAAMNDATQVGANTVFNIDANDSVTLLNVSKSSLAAKNFHIA